MLLKLALGSQHSELCQHLENLALSAWGGKEFFSYKWEEWISLQQHLHYPFLCEIENSHAPSKASWCSQTTDGKARGALWVLVGCWQLLGTFLALPEHERPFPVHPASGYMDLSAYWSQFWWVCAVQRKQFCSWVYRWSARNRKALTECRFPCSGTRSVPCELVGSYKPFLLCADKRNSEGSVCPTTHRAASGCRQAPLGNPADPQRRRGRVRLGCLC